LLTTLKILSCLPQLLKTGVYTHNPVSE
jgi:hypothetical protein